MLHCTGRRTHGRAPGQAGHEPGGAVPEDPVPHGPVYGYTSWPTLRLVTCGGEFDPRTGHYLGNTVAFASYVGQRG